MTVFTRRGVMKGAAGLAATAAFAPAFTATLATAAAPAAGKQTAGWYRYKVGDFEVTVVTDGINRVKFPDNFVVNAKRDDVNNALAAAFMEKDMIAIPYCPIVVNTGSKLIVIDTGTGEANFVNSKGAGGQFNNNLAASGIDANAVDAVIISHYHPDHVNGLLKADNSLAFANAEILVPAAEHKFWMDDAEMNKATGDRMTGLFKNNRRVFGNAEVAKRVKTYVAGKEAVPGITAVATHGHSAGHNSHVVSSGGKSVFVTADVTNVPFLFARNPGWHLVFDQDPQVAEATRRKVYDMLAADKMMVQGFHYPFPAVAYVEKTGTGYREIPVPWSPTI